VIRALVIVAALATPVLAQPLDPYDPPAPAPAPEPPLAPDAALASAGTAATAGDWARVAELVAPLQRGLRLDAADRAEVHRLAGLAAFFLGRPADAERELLAYMKLDLDARLDPALVPPEAITFFEDVRARHGAELRALRPKPKRYFILNLIPPAGQIQNGHKTKGIVIGAGLGTLLAANLTTYFVLRDWCGGDHNLCEDGGSDRAARARTLRTVNIATGVAAATLYLYGVVDGVRHYRKKSRELHFEPRTDGGAIVLSGRF
jgi:hypothetical protein